MFNNLCKVSFNEERFFLVLRLIMLFSNIFFKFKTGF